MSGKSLAEARAYLNLIYNATSIANIADNADTAPLTDLYLALHTADPTDTGNQSSNELAYAEYARVAVPRDATGFTLHATLAQINLTNNVSFPQTAVGGNAVVTHFSIGKLASGAGDIIHSGATTTSITLTDGETVIPTLTDDTTVTES